MITVYQKFLPIAMEFQSTQNIPRLFAVLTKTGDIFSSKTVDTLSLKDQLSQLVTAHTGLETDYIQTELILVNEEMIQKKKTKELRITLYYGAVITKELIQQKLETIQFRDVADILVNPIENHELTTLVNIVRRKLI